MTIDLYDKVRRDFDAMFRKQEAENGIFREPGDCFVAEEDLEPLTTVDLCSAIPKTPDPYGCENPVSGDEE
jgi:hypothetical protein